MNFNLIEKIILAALTTAYDSKKEDIATTSNNLLL